MLFRSSHFRNGTPAARAAGVPFLKWLLWALRCEAKRVVAWDDPMPLLRGMLWRGASHLVYAASIVARAMAPLVGAVLWRGASRLVHAASVVARVISHTMM